MTYEKWAKENFMCIDIDSNAREIWNGAILEAAIAIESANHNDDDSGIAANCNAMIAVEKLKTKI
tara:strand:- start:233 stop:427 length:195 start_codon:yes stop_codon:yes gene_type:complete